MINKFCDKLISDKLIKVTLSGIFSKPSVIVHTIWFILWFAFGLDVSLLTNIVSLEAIYIGILIGIQQIHHHKETAKHIDNINPKAKN